MVIRGSLRSSLAYLATLGPIGHLRPAPGTIGSFVGVVSGYMIASYGAGILVAATLLVTVIGILCFFVACLFFQVYWWHAVPCQ